MKMTMTIKNGKLQKISSTGGYTFAFSTLGKELKWEDEKTYFGVRTLPIIKGKIECALFQKIEGPAIEHSKKVNLGEAIPKWLPLKDGSYHCDDCY